MKTVTLPVTTHVPTPRKPRRDFPEDAFVIFASASNQNAL